MTTNELEIWRTLNKCEAVKKVFGGWCPGDRYYCIGNSAIFTHPEDYDENVPCACDVWIPPLYDPVRPEGSLIEILYTILVNKHDDGWRDIKHLYGWAREEIGRIVGLSDRPDLELAKAIIEQEGE